jgi:3',5'-cyclic AMP phosphodiesterase CpdA
MLILLVSDLHYTLKQLDWVASVAADYDVVVMAGDHLDIASIVEPDAQIAVVLEYLSRIAAKTTLVACSGNHDLNAHNEHGERSARWLEAARGSGVFVDGTSFGNEREMVTVCPWWDGPRLTWGALADGSGCTTLHPTLRRPVGRANGTTATRSSSRGSSSTGPP